MFKLAGGLSEDFSCPNDNATGPFPEVISPRALNQQTVTNKPVIDMRYSLENITIGKRPTPG
jgi:hypothetical protein